jgi:hypothetical protein
MNVGDIWRWTRNSREHPNEPEHNYFLVLDIDWGVDVLYLASGKRTLYAVETFTINKDFLELVA